MSEILKNHSTKLAYLCVFNTLDVTLVFLSLPLVDLKVLEIFMIVLISDYIQSADIVGRKTNYTPIDPWESKALPRIGVAFRTDPTKTQ